MKNQRAFKAYEAGQQAFRAGKRLNENPYLYMSSAMLGLSAWWEAGWNEAKKHQDESA